VNILSPLGDDANTMEGQQAASRCASKVKSRYRPSALKMVGCEMDVPPGGNVPRLRQHEIIVAPFRENATDYFVGSAVNG
jgi:hypothetical protein